MVSYLQIGVRREKEQNTSTLHATGFWYCGLSNWLAEYPKRVDCPISILLLLPCVLINLGCTVKQIFVFDLPPAL